MIRKNYKYIIAFTIIIMASISFSLAWNDSLTFDEVAHIPAGYSYVVKHDYRLNPEHPPLLKVLSGIAILPLRPHFDTSQDFWTTADSGGEFGQWTAGRYLLHQAGNNTDWLVFLARTPIILISVGFALFLFYWGRKIGGVITGLFALILYAFDPNILGHNHFVTTDLGIAVVIAIAFYFFLSFLKYPTWANALYGGLTLGVAQVTKFSAIMLIPFFGLLLVIYPLIIYIKKDQNRLRICFDYLIKGVCAMITMVCMIWIVYIPVTYNMPASVLSTIAPIKAQTEEKARDQIFLTFIEKTNQYTLLRPYAMYTQGLMQVLNRVDGGNGSYFLQNVSSDASPLYFPFVFIAKQTLIHLFFYTIAIILFFAALFYNSYDLVTKKMHGACKRFRSFVVFRFHELTLGLFIVFYSYISITGNLNIGFRHLFPMMPLLYILTAKVVIDSYKNLRGKKRKTLVRNTFSALLAVLVITVISAYPYYMSYFNILFGGPKNGYTYVTDSNSDWGQDLKRLKAYLNEHPEIDKIRIDYFGGDNIHNRIGEGKYILWWDSKRPIERGYYAISVNYLQGSIYDKNKPYDDSYQWTKDLKPIDQVGTSILIYKID